jgi:hypothetical protein
VFVKDGYNIRDCELFDCICIKDNQIVVIETDKEIKNNQITDSFLENYLDKKTYFECKTEVDEETGEVLKQTYVKTGQFRTLKNVAELRGHLYENGFRLDGIPGFDIVRRKAWEEKVYESDTLELRIDSEGNIFVRNSSVTGMPYDSSTHTIVVSLH